MKRTWRNFWRILTAIFAVAVLAVAANFLYDWYHKPVPGKVSDEAMLAGRAADSSPPPMKTISTIWMTPSTSIPMK